MANPAYRDRSRASNPPPARERALRRLFALFQQGVLSESELRIKKWEVLGKLQ